MLRTRDPQNVLAAAAVLLFAVTAFVIHFISPGVFDMGDGVYHYQIARYSWAHPHLLLDHWGKPFYTLLCSPFAQFGYTGAVIFNILCASGTLWIITRIASRFELPFPAAAALLAGFSPLFFDVAISGLTEPLFALVLSGSILLVLRGNFRWGALLVSFLPFVRTEGFLLLPLFGLLLLFRRQWIAVLLVGAGSALYSIIGGIAKGDFLWIIHNNPYKGAEEIYGRGSIFHFLKQNETILGTAGVVLFVAGCLFFAYRFFTKKKTHAYVPEEILLVFGCFFTYFVAHSIFWRFGLVGSLGLLRVLAAVSPLAAIVALSAFRNMQLTAPKIRITLSVLLLLGCVTNAVQTLRQSMIPFKIENEYKPLHAATAFVNSGLQKTDIVYAHHPYLVHLLNRDPFDETLTRNYWILYNDSAVLKPGSYILWESHFAPDCGWTIEKVEQLKGVKLQKTFRGDYEEQRANGTKEWPEVRLYKVE